MTCLFGRMAARERCARAATSASSSFRCSKLSRLPWRSCPRVAAIVRHGSSASHFRCFSSDRRSVRLPSFLGVSFAILRRHHSFRSGLRTSGESVRPWKRSCSRLHLPTAYARPMESGSSRKRTSSTRLETTVIADAVNRASRIESLTEEMRARILITDDTRAALRSVVSPQRRSRGDRNV